MAFFIHQPDEYEGSKLRLKPNLKAFWKYISQNIFNSCGSKMIYLSRSRIDIGVELFLRDFVSLTNMLECYGLNSVFCRCRFHIVPNIRRVSLAEKILKTLAMKDTPLRYIDALKEIGIFSQNSKLPWKIECQYGSWISAIDIALNDEKIELIRSNRDLAFGIFVVIAAILEREIHYEVSSKEVQRQIIERLANDNFPILILFRNILLARFDEEDCIAVDKELNSCNFSKNQCKFIDEWIHGRGLIERISAQQ
jgi:hypothetical protein